MQAWWDIMKEHGIWIPNMMQEGRKAIPLLPRAAQGEVLKVPRAAHTRAGLGEEDNPGSTRTKKLAETGKNLSRTGRSKA